MATQRIRVLVTGSGTGSSGNLIRALKLMRPKPYVVGLNHDRFTIRMSIADKNYLCPEPSSEDYVNWLLQVVRNESVSVVMPTEDNVVKRLSDARHKFAIDLMLPSRETIDLCQDKLALSVFLRRRGVPAPTTYAVTSLQNLEKIFARFFGADLLWCRARRGSRSLGAIPVATVEQARAWITQWRDLRGVKVSDFTICKYLPGRHFIVQSVWQDGDLLCAQTMEVLSYFAAGNNPSGVFSLSSLAKTVVAPDALRAALDAVQALERRPSGTFFIELKETENGVPSITEINAGRFPSGVTALLAAGNDNMVAVFASAAIGKRIDVAEPHGSAREHYLVRDIDAVPSVFAADEVAAGVHRVVSRVGRT